MAGWTLNGIGPQKGPATTARLKAKWRQVDRENQEAREVRKQWMTLIGCDKDEITQACNQIDLSLEEELEQLGAAIRLNPR
ncbi:MAG: hypothetical protein JNL58_26940 [Planctomyces sp.]|nr:hypothetical protein [Planctomyces sp.]